MILVFMHDGYKVVTQSWSVASRGKGIRLVYCWGADGISFFDSATGTAAVSIPGLSVDVFLALLGSASVLDLRQYQ